MPAEAYELIESRRVSYGDNGRCEQLWQVVDTDDEVEAYTTLVAAIASSYDVYGDASMIWYRQNITVETTDANLWNYKVTYGTVRGAGADAADFEFDTTAATQHINYGRKNLGMGIAPGTGQVTDYKLGINVTPDGPQGVDILWPQYTFTETHPFASADVDFAFKRNIFDLTGCVNKATLAHPTFKGFAEGEVLFAGASGKKNTNSGIWMITYRFMASPNRTLVPFNGTDTIPAVKGWDYLWVTMEPIKSGPSERIILRPFQWNITQVYEYKDLSLLDIGA